MCITTKDFFVLCPHNHWTSITVNKKEIGKPALNSCNCNGKTNKFYVVISEKTYNRNSGSQVNYWNEKEQKEL